MPVHAISAPPAAGSTLSSLLLTPAGTSLHVGAGQQFVVAARWSDGSTSVPALTWSATGGTITTAGFYRAGALRGTYRVIARQQGGSTADTSVVTLTTLARLNVAPATVGLAAGASAQLTASGTRSDGSVDPQLVTWSATGGTITTAGLYTAGSAAGTFRVIAVNKGGSMADSSIVTVTAAGGTLANECAAPRAGWVWCDDFEQDRMSRYFEVDNAGGSFTRTNGVGNAGSFGMRIKWAAGQQNGGSLHLALGKTPQGYFKPADAGTAKYRELYWRMYVRHQAGWTGGGGDKLSRAFVFASSSTWAQAAAGHVWSGMGSDANHLEIDPYRGTDAAGNLVTTGFNDFAHFSYLGAAEGKIQLFDASHVGQWYCVEAHMRLNDAGQSNGAFDVWVNGQLDASRTGLNWLGSFSSYGINTLFFENFWNSGSPKAQERYFDNIVVSTSRIGC
ncbi:MAG: polysaccharide lyase [Gemmatimonadota bacterium]